MLDVSKTTGILAERYLGSDRKRKYSGLHTTPLSFSSVVKTDPISSSSGYEGGNYLNIYLFDINEC